MSRGGASPCKWTLDAGRQCVASGDASADVASSRPATGTCRQDMPANINYASERAKAEKEAFYGGRTRRVPEGNEEGRAWPPL